jgi:tRNA/tmRNA/rRNA uracil-C5-methylase (TrmA/RlmC/RlmD family)
LSGLPLVDGESLHYRCRARLAIRGRLGSPKLGLFEFGTHRVVHIPNCGVHHPLINQVADTVRRALVETRTSCYSEGAQQGLARYLQVVVERSSQSAQVVLTANCPDPRDVAPCLDLIRERMGDRLHSLWFNANTERANTILGSRFQRWCGPGSVTERFGGPAVHYPPGAFGQNNLDVAQKIVGYVRSLVPAGARVAEFYAGVGAIGLSLIDRVDTIKMNEISADSLHGLELGLADLIPAQRGKVSVIAGEAGAALEAAAGSTFIIVDPPRKGLDAALVERWRENPPEQICYVSCAPESLDQDAAQLTSLGKLRLSSLAAFNLMPYTAHVETVAVFQR